MVKARLRQYLSLGRILTNLSDIRGPNAQFVRNQDTSALARHHGYMSIETRSQAEAQLRDVAKVYDEAVATLKSAKERAEAAVKEAKNVGLSQHDIARIMGPVWGADHNPQYPPVLDLQKPRPPADDEA